MVPPDSHGISRAPCYLGYQSGVVDISPTGVPPSMPGLSMPFGYDDDFLLPAGLAVPTDWSHNPAYATPASYHAYAVWPLPFSLATTRGITGCFLFLWVLRWFTSPRCLLTAYGFSGGSFGISQRGFPHSEIPGSKPICGSPGLIAAYRVLRRLLVPRHSPYTLSSLTIRNSN